MITIQFNTDQVISTLTDVQKKHVPFAVQLTLNRTAEDRQRRMQDRISTQLTIRSGSTKEQFRRVVRFARQDRADRKAGQTAATLRILGSDTAATAPLFQRLGALVLRHEEGGSRTSSALYRTPANTFTPGGFIIPAPGLRSANKAMPRKLYPSAIGLSTRQAIAGGTAFASTYKGGKKKRGKGFKKGTKFYFVKPGVGIFVREQVGARSEYDAVWFFTPRITLPKRLRLEETFVDGLAEQLHTNFNGLLLYALRTAK